MLERFKELPLDNIAVPLQDKHVGALDNLVDAIIAAGHLPDPKQDNVKIKGFIMANAELQSLCLWLENRPIKEGDDKPALEIALFPSKYKEEDGQKDKDNNKKCLRNALVIQNYLRRLAQDDLPFLDRWGLSSIEVTIEPIDISVESSEKFARSIDSLFETFDRKRMDEKEKDTSFLINSTGSYKAVVTYATLYGQINQLPCIYSFENNTKDYLHLTPLPLSFALAELDDEMALLQGVKEGAGGLLNDKQAEALPDWLKGLMTQDEEGNRKTLGLAGVLVDHYRTNRRKTSGVGQGMIERIRQQKGGGPIADYIEERIQKEWAELWLGDQIPETVEHSRRHSKRLMEIAANVFRSARPEDVEAVGLNDAKALALFVTAIYLHDIGHTALAFPVTPSGGGAFPLGLFPSSVREVHHLLSRDLILAEGEDLLPDDGSDLAPMLRELVPLVCAYHRGYTHLLKEQKTAQPKGAVSQVGKLLFGDEHFNETLRPLEEVLEAKKGKIAAWGLSIPKVLACAALLRVVDGCDVQADRTVDDVYLKARQKRTEKEAQALWQQLSFFNSKLPADLRCKLDTLSDLINPERIDDLLRDNDQVEAIKTLTGDIYTAVFDKLNALKGSGDWAFINKDFEKIQALSLANRVAFKWEQFLHFGKHQAVGFVLPMPSADGKGVTIGIWPNNELRPDNAALEKVRESIQEELSGKADDQARGKQRLGGIGDILESLGLKPEVMGGRRDGR
ncbi:MAG: hypothetical protein JMJ93_03215 [Synergistaceae bacterium]|nr:hypothetical protein [Synergistaceae bacterium]